MVSANGSGLPADVASHSATAGGHPANGGDLRRWTATGFGKSRARVAARITKKEARMGMMKAGRAGLPLIGDIHLPTGDVHQEAALRAGVIRVLREAVIPAVQPEMRAGSSRAEAGDQVMAADRLQGAVVPAAVDSHTGLIQITND